MQHIFFKNILQLYFMPKYDSRKPFLVFRHKIQYVKHRDS